MFSKESRKIFRYHDGTSERFGDPLAIRRRYWRAIQGENETELFQQAGGPLDIADEALSRLLPIIRMTFEVEPLDPNTGLGLTEDETLELLKSFFDWEADLGEGFGGKPIGSVPTVGPPESS